MKELASLFTNSVILLGVSLVILIPLVGILYFLISFAYEHPIAAAALAGTIGVIAYTIYKHIQKFRSRKNLFKDN